VTGTKAARAEVQHDLRTVAVRSPPPGAVEYREDDLADIQAAHVTVVVAGRE
jgi:hypothetical protein